MAKSRLPNTAIDWLNNDQHGANVLATARNLLAVENVLKKILPPALAQACQVAKIENQQLVLVVPSAAYASKLRQIAPRTAAQLTDNGWNLTEIQVKVQASLAQSGMKMPASKQNIPLDKDAIEAFRQLHKKLSSGPLADAVARLVARHQGF